MYLLHRYLRTFLVLGCVNRFILHVHSLPTQDNFHYKHHDNTEIERILKDTEVACPNISRVFSLREQSVLGKKIFGIVFGREPSQHQILTPEFKYVGGIHGNEVVGNELLLRLAVHLCESHRRNNPEVLRLLHMTRIHIVPNFNPDGWEAATAATYEERNVLTGRTNNNSVDLNRSFPMLDRIFFANMRSAPWKNHHLWNDDVELSKMLQPETRALIQWMQAVPFVLSAGLHGGDLVVNYPFDSPISLKPKVPSYSPDEELFQQLAFAYADSHPHMKGSKCYSDEPGFPEGITNGAAWYSMRGGAEDFSYLATNCFELIMELGCVKYPREVELPQIWADNKMSLMNFMWQSHLGIKGIVYDASTGRGIPGVEVQVLSENGNGEWEPIWHFVTSGIYGDYYRLLRDGKYQVSMSKDGYISQTMTIYVSNNPYRGATRIDFALGPSKVL